MIGLRQRIPSGLGAILQFWLRLQRISFQETSASLTSCAPVTHVHAARTKLTSLSDGAQPQPARGSGVNGLQHEWGWGGQLSPNGLRASPTSAGAWPWSRARGLGVSSYPRGKQAGDGARELHGLWMTVTPVSWSGGGGGGGWELRASCGSCHSHSELSPSFLLFRLPRWRSLLSPSRGRSTVSLLRASGS